VLEKLGKYQITDKLGEGGFGTVYKALDPTFGRVVAIKVMKPGTDETLAQRFRNEAAACGSLRHKNIVSVYDFGDADGLLYLVMEYVAGEDLQKAMSRGRAMGLEEKVQILYEVADGLYAAHKQKIIHRDIKPANVMLTEDGVRLMDFGIARRKRDARLTTPGMLVGSYAYMAPEQLMGGAPDERTDIWSFGVLAYYLLSGTHPFETREPTAAMLKIAREHPPKLRTVVQGCPEKLEKIVERLIAKDPAERYQTLADVLVDLAPVRDALKGTPTGQAWPTTSMEKMARDAWAVFKAGNVSGGLEKIDEALKLYPGQANLLRLRATMLEQQPSAAARFTSAGFEGPAPDPAKDRRERAAHLEKMLGEARRALDGGDKAEAQRRIDEGRREFPQETRWMVMAEEVARMRDGGPKPAAAASEKPEGRKPAAKKSGVPVAVWALAGLLLIGGPVGYLMYRMLSGPPGPVTVTPGSLDFQATRNGEAAPKKMAVGGAAGVSFEAAPTSDWLDVAPRTGRTPAEIEVRPRPGVLPPGKHFAFVEVTPKGGLKQNFPVSVTIPRR
jgi:predicted Ser/Thr protein kinase